MTSGAAKRLARLPASIAGDVEPWLVHLRHGDSRHRPKAPGTWRGYCTAIMPVLLAWGQEHATLREITRDDIVEALAGPRTCSGDNHTLAIALRSLFGSSSPAGGSSPTLPADCPSTSDGIVTLRCPCPPAPRRTTPPPLPWTRANGW